MADPTVIPVTAKAEELRARLRRSCLGPQLGSFYVFCKSIMGYKDLTESFHLPLCNHIQSTLKDLKRGYLEMRGGFKSTIVGKSYPPWRLLGGGSDAIEDILELEDSDELLAWYSKNPDIDPRNHRILILSESQDIANKDLKDLKWKIENDQQFQWLFPEIIPESTTKTVWNAGEILLPRSRSFDESTLTALGLESAGTGFHYTIIVYDDIAGEKAAKSAPLMEAAKERIKAAPGLLVNQCTSEELFIGTRWKHGTADVPGWMLQEMPFELNSQGRPVGFKWHIRAAETEDEEGNRVALFPERYPLEVLDAILYREKEYLYNCNYMNRPSSPEGSDFNPQMYKEFSIKESKPGCLDTLVPSDGTPEVKLKDLFRVLFYDPSSGGKTAKCEGAIAVGGMAADRRVFVFRAWGKNSGYNEAAHQAEKYNDQYLVHRRLSEDVGSQKEFETTVKLRHQLRVLNGGKCPECQVKHRNFLLELFKPGTGDKHDRIRAYLGPTYEQGRLYIRKGETELKRQLADFPHGDMVDRLDATASMVKNLRAPLTSDEIASQEADVEAAVMERESRTHTSHQYGGYL